jgi:hypothetical protein
VDVNLLRNNLEILSICIYYCSTKIISNSDTYASVFQSSKGRDEWKNKAVQRAGDLREHRKAKKRYLETIVKLKEQIILME